MRTFLALCCLSAALSTLAADEKSRTIQVRPDLDGWDRMAWGTTLEAVQSAYGFSADTRIVSQDEREVVMKKGIGATVPMDLFGAPAQVTFRFNHEGSLVGVSAEYFPPELPDAADLAEILTASYGPCGRRSILDADGKTIIGEEHAWIRRKGELSVEGAATYLVVTWKQSAPQLFPTPLFKAVADKDARAIAFLLDAGADSAVSFEILEDDKGSPAKATALDYALLFAFENPDDGERNAAARALADRGAKALFFSSDAVAEILNQGR